MIAVEALILAISFPFSFPVTEAASDTPVESSASASELASNPSQDYVSMELARLEAADRVRRKTDSAHAAGGKADIEAGGEDMPS